MAGNISVCAAALGDDCMSTGCAKDEICISTNVPAAQTVSFVCAKRCDPFKNECPTNFVCGGVGTQSACFERCQPGSSCDNGRTCVSVSEDRTLWGCR